MLRITGTVGSLGLMWIVTKIPRTVIAILLVCTKIRKNMPYTIIRIY